MVFESVVVDILNRILGDYVENLDSKQLSIGIWGGDVVLQDLVLKQTALDDLNLPVQTVYGRLGKLVLKIPWKNLYGAPVEAAVERLYLLVVPNQEVKYDAEKEEKMAQDAKQAELQRIEAAKKKEAELGKRKGDDTFVEKLSTQIIKNVQVRIQDIHIRYEDTVTNPGKPFAFGITLSNLSVQTTNERWKPAILSETISKIYKVLSLDALAVYWNCNCPLYSTMAVVDILKYFQDGIATRDMKPDNYLYILGPINSSARLRLNPKPENDVIQFSLPKTLLNLEMEKLAIGISKNQYFDIMLLAESMDRMSRGMAYRKYRPFVSGYRGHYRNWWKFAFTCVLEEEVRRRHRNWDWNHIYQHRTVCRQYAEAYQTKLQQKKIPEDVQDMITKGEKTLDVFNLVIIRQRIELEVARLEKKTEEIKKQGSWFGNWFGRSAADEDKELSATAHIMKKFEEAMTPDEKSKLYRAIDYQENSAPAEYPEAFIATSCAFVLRCLEIEIRDDSLKVARVMSTELKGVNCRLQQRPAASALQVAVKIDQFIVFGLQQGDVIPQFVSSEDFSEGGVLLDVLFETKPLDKTCDQRLHVKTQPLKIIYDAQTIIKVAEVFKTPQSLALEQLQAAAGNKLADFKEMSATGLQHAVEQHVTTDLNINLSAPYIVVPYGGFNTNAKSFLVINLGHVKLTSVARDSSQLNVRKMFREGTAEDEILKEVMSQSYDKFLCELTDVQVLIAKDNEDWRICIRDNTITPMHVLQPMNLIVKISKCLVSDDPRLPKLKIAGRLPSIMLNVTDERILNILALVSSIPLPNGNNIEPAPLQKVKSSTLSLFLPDTDKKKFKTWAVKSDIDAFAQTTDLDIKFEMTELIVTISKKKNLDSPEPPEKVLKFQCMALELDMIQQTYNMDIIVRLGGIALTQFRPIHHIQIINTARAAGQDEYLFTVQFTQVDKKSPEFHSKYLSCEQRLQLNFTTLQLQLHQEGLQYLLEFSNDFQTRLADVTKPAPQADRVATAATKLQARHLAIIEENLPINVKSAKLAITKKTRLMVVEAILFKLTANLKELNILIANDRRKLSSFAIQGVKSDIVVKKSYTQIVATLTDLTIIDENPLCKHSKILYKTGSEDALNTQIVMYNLENAIDQNQIDMSVTVTMSCLRITFLNYFVNAILDFLNKFQAAQEAIKEASAAAAETAKQNMQSVYEKATRIQLKVKLKAPVIIVPTNSKSLDAIMLDLGNIILSNRFINLEIENEAGNPAVVDDLKMYLLDVKISRILLDEQLNSKCECMLLRPLSFNVRIKRNLSTSWYIDVPDLDVAGEMKSIELMVSEADYSKIMQILSENLGEGAQVAPTKSAAVHKLEIDTVAQIETAERVTASKPKTPTETAVKSSEMPHALLRFTFTMESLVVNLFKGGIKTLTGEDNLSHSPEDGLARFTMLVLSLKGRILTDGGIITSVLLLDCLLDDTRTGREGNLTRLMERKQESRDVIDESPDNSAADTFTKSMIDITYQQKDTDMFADIRVFSFNLILSMDYLMKIAAFFSPADENETGASPKQVAKLPPKAKPDARATTPKAAVQEKPKESSMTLNLRVEKPDIILVERMDSIDSNALILNNEIILHIRLAGTNQSIRGAINNLQLYTCCYNPAKRHETKCPVLRPCNINVIGATPRNEGLHLDVALTDIRISVSPAIIDLLNSVYATLYASDTASVDESEEQIDYSNIWESEPFTDTDYWFLHTEEGQDAMENMSYELSTYADSPNAPALTQMCNVTALSVVVTIEAGVGNKTLPMLLLEMSFETNVHNWSSKMYIDCSLTTQMAYYNSRLAVWEPLIEPVEVENHDKSVHTPWTLKVEMKCNTPEEQYIMSPQAAEAEPIEEISFTPPNSSITVSSSVNLELVITKTSLEVISNLGKAFATVVKEGAPIKEECTSPYKVINDSGLKVTLLLEEGIFQLYNPDNMLMDYREVVLESGAEVALELKPNEDSVVSLHIAKSISAYSMLHNVQEKELLVHVNDMSCTLKLPVVRADKRYFSLNYRGENKDSWGLISDVTVQGAETIVTLRSMLQVHNHFNQPISVYYMTNRGNELECIKKVAPGASFNLPMQAVYTLTNELFFSVEGHCVTAVPYIWKDLQHNLSMVKTLTCPGQKHTTGQQFVMKVCGDIEQIFHENTNRHTMISTCYNIHLRPAITFKNSLPVPVVCVIQGDVEDFKVEPGNQLHMPTVNPGFSYVVLRLDNYLEKEWSCRHDISSTLTEFSVWQFDSHDSVAKMTLDLGMHCENKNGTQVLSLYCPFWMLNKTGLMLSYRKSSKTEKNQTSASPAKNSDESVNILHHPEDFKGPILFSFSAKNFFGKKKAAIRIGNGEWSDKFSLDVAGSSGMVVCKSNNMPYQIGVHNQLTYNGLTKQVTFIPYYVLINNAPFVVECQELERPADAWLRVEPNSCSALWPRADREDRLLVARVLDTTEVTAPFLITEPHNTLLKLFNKHGGINVDIQVTEGAIYINFTAYQSGLAPALIINHTQYKLSFWEKESVNVRHLERNYKMLYTWDNPNGPRSLIWDAGKKKEIEDDLRKDGLGEFALEEDYKIYWVSFLNSTQRVILFTQDPGIAQDAQSAGDLENIEQEITVSIHGVGISLVNNFIRQEILYIAIASSGIIWEACKMSSKRFKQLSVKDCAIIEAAYQHYLMNPPLESGPIAIDQKYEIDFKNELMLRPHKRRIRRAFQTGVWFQMKTSPNQLQLHAKINRVQIDNQMYDCIFPVVLAPVPPPKSVAADSALKPFAELSIVQRVMKYSKVQQYKYFKVLIQEFHIKVDLGFVNAVMTLFEAEEPTEYDEAQLFIKDMSLVDEPLLAHVSTQSLQEQKNFYDLLHFSPLKIHVSFSLAAPSGAGATQSGSLSEGATPAFLNVLLQGLGVTLTDMQDVVFRLAFFERTYKFLTQKELTTEATKHYTGQALKQLYVLVLGLDVIGNPYGLVLGLTKGVEDLFYEPFQGAIQGPGEFAEGLVLGVRSLFGHTVGGAAGAVSRITGAMGKGIAALTFDKDYQRKRRDQINKKPANIQEGLARGGKGLVMGVFDGVTGVFTKPITGAKEQGVEGFFKGLGKGAVGLVTRPTAGVIDFASGSLDAVKRAAEMGEEVTRLRAPRFMRADCLVRPYIRQEAEGNKLLIELEKGKYAGTDLYHFHIWIIQGKDILLLTDKRLAYIVHNDIFGGWQVEWAYTWQEIHVPAKVVDRGVQVTTGEPKKKVLGLFGSGENGKVIIIVDPIMREIVKDKIEYLRENA